MSRSPQNAIRIAAPSASGTLSKVRKKFNALVRQLDAERARLALWRDEMPKIRALADSELVPLEQAFDERRRSLVFLFDEAWSSKALGKRDREKLSDIIMSTVLSLMDEGQDDDDIRALYNRHATGVFDPDADRAHVIGMVSAATGVALDDDADLSSPHAIYEAVRNKIEEQYAQQHREAEAQAEQAGDFREEPAHAARPAKAHAREARHEAEENKLKQSVREIFRKLASVLHPDRETDPAERARKTALMQRANVAYGANDLLGLLELQLEVEQIDQNGLDMIGEDRIRQYNKILGGQVNDVKAELDALEFALSMEMGWDVDRRPTVKAMLSHLRSHAAMARAQVKRLDADLEKFRDIKQLKAWLKHYRIAPPAPDFGDDFFF